MRHHNNRNIEQNECRRIDKRSRREINKKIVRVSGSGTRKDDRKVVGTIMLEKRWEKEKRRRRQEEYEKNMRLKFKARNEEKEKKRIDNE